MFDSMYRHTAEGVPSLERLLDIYVDPDYFNRTYLFSDPDVFAINTILGSPEWFNIRYDQIAKRKEDKVRSSWPLSPADNKARRLWLRHIMFYLWYFNAKLEFKGKPIASSLESMGYNSPISSSSFPVDLIQL